MKTWPWIIASILFGGCASSNSKKTVATVQAPSSVTAWSWAEINVYHEVSKGGGGHGSGPTTFEMAAVELWVHGTETTLPIRYDSYFGSKQLLVSRSGIRQVRGRPYKLAVSPKGDWLAFSAKRGSWMPVQPGSLLLCTHVHLEGDKPRWDELPPVRDLVLDILAHAAGKRGPLGIDHAPPERLPSGGNPHSAWNRTQSLQQASELWAAGNWARMQPDDEALQQAVADVLLGLPGNYILGEHSNFGVMQRSLARAAVDHRSIRERLLAQFTDPTATTMALTVSALQTVADQGRRQDKQPLWPPTYQDPSRDAFDYSVGSARPEGWAQVALDALRRPGPRQP